MAIVDVDDSSLQADSQPKGLLAWLRVGGRQALILRSNEPGEL